MDNAEGKLERQRRIKKLEEFERFAQIAKSGHRQAWAKAISADDCGHYKQMMRERLPEIERRLKDPGLSETQRLNLLGERAAVIELMEENA